MAISMCNGLAAAVLAAALAGTSAQAQNSGPPNALQGFAVNRDKPIRIQSATLEVHDKQKLAIFTGDVHVVQGDTDMRCKVLDVYYEEDTAKDSGSKTSAAGPGGSSQIRRMEAKGGVVVTKLEQVATGDTGEFDMRTNTVTLIGNVVVTKGTDVVKGQRLIVNLTTGVSRVESGGGRVEMLMDSRPRSDSKSGQQQGAPSPRPGRSN